MADKTEEKKAEEAKEEAPPVEKAEEKLPKVKNISGKKVPILQYVVLPDGRAVKKFSGEVLPELPHDVADTIQCKRLADMGLLEIEGYKTPRVTAEKMKAPVKVPTESKVPPKLSPSKPTPQAKPKEEKSVDKPSTKGKKEKSKEDK